jgi:hypothetical protein
MANKQRKNLAQRIGEFFSAPKTVMSELIGRVSHQLHNLYYRTTPTIDYTQTDYEWYDKLRNGKLAGFEIGGLFAKPMAEIISSWSLGDGFSIEQKEESEDTEEAVHDFLEQYLQMLVESNEDKLSLGDAYILVNADGSLQKISPEQVEIERDELDFNRILSISICTNNNAVQIEDKYTPTQRIVTIKRNGAESIKRFPNLIGRIPIVQFSHDRSPNEAFGHPYFDALLTLFAEYDDVIRKGLDGVKIMGNPIPVVEGLKDADAAKRTNASYSETYVDNQGNTQTDYRTELSPNNVYYFGEGARMHFAAPGDFTGNTTDMLKKLFYVMLQHAKIPEWVWGGAISSSMASVEAQAPAFVKFIEGQRRKIEQPIQELLEIYLASISLFTPNISQEGFSIVWPELMPVDKELMLKWAMWLKENGLITAETALRLGDVVRDVSTEVDKAQKEKRENDARVAREKMNVQGQQMRQNARNPMPMNGDKPNGANNGQSQQQARAS